MKDCDSFQTVIEAARRGAALPADEAELAEHLLRCTSCQRYEHLTTTLENSMNSYVSGISSPTWDEVKRGFSRRIWRLELSLLWALPAAAVAGFLAAVALADGSRLTAMRWTTALGLGVGLVGLTLAARFAWVVTTMRELARADEDFFFHARRSLENTLRRERLSQWLTPLVLGLMVVLFFDDGTTDGLHFSVTAPKVFGAVFLALLMAAQFVYQWRVRWPRLRSAIEDVKRTASQSNRGGLR